MSAVSKRVHPSGVRSSPRLRRLSFTSGGHRYRANARFAYVAALLCLGPLAAPSSLTIAAGALTLQRIALFLVSLPIGIELFRKVTSGGYLPTASDVVVPLMAAWILVTLYVNEGIKSLVGYGAVSAIEFLVAYFLARVYFGTPTGFNQFIKVLKIIVLLITITALLDTLLSQHVSWTIGRILSGTSAEDIVSWRFGLIRAQGSLENPILLGVFMVICIILLASSGLPDTEKPIWISIGLLGVLLPLSSAPLLSLFMSATMFLMLRTVNRFPWGILFIVLFAIYTFSAFLLLVDDPLRTLIRNLTIDPQTGLYRVTIWQWAAYNIRRAPWTGIGFTDWVRDSEMSSTMDSLYLVQAVRFGLPAAILLVLSMVTTGITMPLRAQILYRREDIRSLRQGLSIAIFILLFNAFTVHFWGAIWTMLAIVLGCRAGLTESQYLHPYARGEPPVRAGARPVRMSVPEAVSRAAGRPIQSQAMHGSSDA